MQLIKSVFVKNKINVILVNKINVILKNISTNKINIIQKILYKKYYTNK